MKWPASSPLASRVGRAVKSRDTAWEVSTRSALWRAGFRFRKSDRRLPGSPDLSFPSRRLAVFLDSCFWHSCPVHGATPKANRPLWEEKFRRNRGRDRAADASLAALGWRILRVWSHEADPVAVVLGALGAP